MSRIHASWSSIALRASWFYALYIVNGSILFFCDFPVYHCYQCLVFVFFFFQAEDGIRDLVRSRGLGDVYKRQAS